MDGSWFHARGARNEPPPLEAGIPLLIGGSGERRTLPIVARDADAWNGEGDPETFARKNALLDELCRAQARESSSVRRTVGLPPVIIRNDRSEAVTTLAERLSRHGLSRTSAEAVAVTSPLVGPPALVAARLREYHDAGAEEVVIDWPSPSDLPTLEALATEVREELTS